jgi:hypothetical protein
MQRCTMNDRIEELDKFDAGDAGLHKPIPDMAPDGTDPEAEADAAAATDEKDPDREVGETD